MKARIRNLTRWRVLWLTLGMAGFMAFLVGRLVVIQVADKSFLDNYEASFQVKHITIPAQRGEIIDRNGTVLAMDVPRDQVIAAPRYIHHPAQEAGVLAKYLPFKAKVLRRVLSNKSWYALLDNSVSPAVANKINRLQLTGIATVPVTGREYPNGTLASQVLGMVGSNGQGLAGIEYADNKLLSGTPGHWTVREDAYGNPMLQWQQAYTPPKPGDTVQLTIDANVEAQAQKWLKWGIKRAHAKNGTVIIMNVKTGGIVALANWPNYNPNNLATVTSENQSDFGVQYLFPPGSIFKPVTTAAALSLGLFTPNSLFYTDGYKIVDGVRINDWNPKGWGWITLTRGLEVSSDQVFMDVALKLGVSGLYQFVHAFGLDHAVNVGLPGSASPLWIPKSQVNPVDLATEGFGQGFATTAMEIIAADDAIANNGTLVQPHIVKDIISPSGKVTPTKVTVEGKPVTPQVALEIQHMMTLEATKGTGVPAQVPGYIIAGKTGTAQKIVNGHTSNSNFVASYLGYGPMPHPKFIMLVSINHPVGSLFYGDQVSAPVWKHIATYLFKYWNIKPYAGPDNGSKPGPIP
ncbi:peptidoglycan D,D-transpeptidase FtsI family protein [Sulfobacillus harzensis]|uniref:Penicillin-binding protein 2 n=1 Tax=Sulfobacillus harzensis TaxID=2729629 RepID=A0A7Y0L1L6_9FIRM|nr:penicillin-binding protein 2 [Sulfobacillus harzensis]NMP21608.1 penicillin-binding protein 2 [Sulfobacillus harzensis]